MNCVSYIECNLTFALKIHFMKTVFIYTQKKRMFHEKNLKRANADPVVLKSMHWIWISYKTKPTEV